jgi:hypothetical protein
VSLLGWWETFWLGLALGMGFRFASVVVEGARLLGEAMQARLTRFTGIGRLVAAFRSIVRRRQTVRRVRLDAMSPQGGGQFPPG